MADNRKFCDIGIILIGVFIKILNRIRDFRNGVVLRVSEAFIQQL